MRKAFEKSIFFEGTEGEEDEEEDVPEDLADLEPEEQQKRIKIRAAYQMALGTLLAVTQDTKA